MWPQQVITLKKRNNLRPYERNWKCQFHSHLHTLGVRCKQEADCILWLSWLQKIPWMISTFILSTFYVTKMTRQGKVPAFHRIPWDNAFYITTPPAAVLSLLSLSGYVLVNTDNTTSIPSMHLPMMLHTRIKRRGVSASWFPIISVSAWQAFQWLRIPFVCVKKLCFKTHRCKCGQGRGA